MSYRNEVDALAARHAALEAEVTERQHERDIAADLLREARARASRPVLDDVRVASPCRADWSKMSGDERVRACGDCHKNVYNLSEMTRDEAEALIVEHEGRLCVRYFRRADGTILTKDCAVGVRRGRRRKLVAAGVMATLAGSIAAYQLRSTAEPEPVVGTMRMGEMKIVPPSAPPTDPTPVMGAMVGSGAGQEWIQGGIGHEDPPPPAPPPAHHHKKKAR